MNITSKSLHHSNIAFVFNDAKFFVPENGEFNSLYAGQEAAGVRFIDDPIMRAKVLTLPRIKIKISLEGRRLRIDDDSQNEPQDSRLVKDAAGVYEKLFQRSALEGFGFNFDIYYRFDGLIPIREIYEDFFGKDALKVKELRDFGIQFSLEDLKNNFIDTYFLKITAPIEMAVHLNRHFAAKKFPPQERLSEMFLKCYNEADSIIGKFRS